MVLPASKRPARLRTILLAYPTRVTKKYVPPVYTGRIFTGVRRSAVRGKAKENWRLDQLAIPTRRVPKYVFVEESGTGVKPSALCVQISPRTDDMSKPLLRYIITSQAAYRGSNPKVVNNFTKTVVQSWNTIYSHYRKQEQEIQRKKNERLAKQKVVTTKSTKELKEEREKLFAVWCETKAIPRREFFPPPLPKSPVANLRAIMANMSNMAEPRQISPKYKRPSIDPTYVDPLRVTPAARAYVASERVLELSKTPDRRMIKEIPIIPGAVCRGALTGPVPPRFAELATPKKKAAEKDSDLKENPFQISPNALKAKPSARTKELAKPIDR